MNFQYSQLFQILLYVTGVLCQENVNECASSPCLNNGLCIDLPQRFECECQAGFQGTLCEINIDECRSAPCKNAISCIDKVRVLSFFTSHVGPVDDSIILTRNKSSNRCLLLERC